MAAKKPTRRRRRGWGKVRKLPSGRYQASYIGPDEQRHTAPATFETDMDAEAWVASERRLTQDQDTWTTPAAREAQRKVGNTLRDFAPEAIRRRKVRGRALTPRTIAHYDRLLERVLFPTFGDTMMNRITPEQVTAWYDDLPAEKATQRAHAYSLLSSLLDQDIAEEGQRTRRPVTRINPCRIKGAGVAERKREIRPASLSEIVTIANAMPKELQALVLLAAWCGLRFGELIELRRKDIHLSEGTVRVERGAVWVNGRDEIGDTKSAAGKRTVALPPHIVPILETHLDEHTGNGDESLLFPRSPGTDEHWPHGPFYRLFMVARNEAGRDDLRLHDLRHTSAVLAAQSGATLAELMKRLGHSTPGMALRYQHVADGRDQQLAAALSKLAGHDDANG